MKNIFKLFLLSGFLFACNTRKGAKNVTELKTFKAYYKEIGWSQYFIDSIFGKRSFKLDDNEVNILKEWHKLINLSLGEERSKNYNAGYNEVFKNISNEKYLIGLPKQISKTLGSKIKYIKETTNECNGKNKQNGGILLELESLFPDYQQNNIYTPADKRYIKQMIQIEKSKVELILKKALSKLNKSKNNKIRNIKDINSCCPGPYDFGCFTAHQVLSKQK